MNDTLIQEDINRVSKALLPYREAFGSRRIFLTGGTGFFGKWLLHTFLGLRKAFAAEASLTVLSRDPRNFLEANPEFSEQKGLNFVAGDVRTFDFNGLSQYDDVFHAATAASAKLEQENPDEMYSVITKGTKRVIEFTRSCCAKRLLFISSGAVYGPQPPDLSHIPETYDGQPIAAYGRGKKASEELCLEASCGHFDCVIARPFAFVGPYLPLDAHFAVGNFISDVLAGRPIGIKGDGRPIRSYQYASDLAEWLWIVLLKGTPGRAYNVGSDEPVSIEDLAHRVRACAKTDTTITVRERPVPNVPPHRYVPSVERAKTELGLMLRVGLDTAIKRTIDWHQSGLRGPSF